MGNKSQSQLEEEITRTIAKVRELSGPTIGVSNARAEAARQLAQLTKKIDPNEIDDQTLADLVSLLDTWDDAVRMEVALSLGNLGPRAKATAAPKLVEIVPEIHCLWVDTSSEDAILLALKRMGETPPTPPPCEKVVDPVLWKQRISTSIAQVRMGEPAVVREKAAMHVAYLMFWLRSEQIDDGTVTDLVSLLDIPDQAVRDGVAGALGKLGHRAKSSAAPKLQTLLAEVDCRKVNLDSAELIRETLVGMGVKAPQRKCGDK
jgi:hypothetical protein